MTLPRRLEGIEEFLGEVETMPVGEKVAQTFAELRARQLDTGRLTPSIDLWIAATAIAHELTLVTHRTRLRTGSWPRARGLDSALIR